MGTLAAVAGLVVGRAVAAAEEAAVLAAVEAVAAVGLGRLAERVEGLGASEDVAVVVEDEVAAAEEAAEVLAVAEEE